ncbi:MAG: RNA pseudouridine synthase [Myxococcales bacterium]|nr:RNA pseudouridine synthase [Myxococcales bacterium]
MVESWRERVTLVHRDRDLLVLHKPSGLPTTAPAGGVCLVQLARELDPEAPQLHPSSRLDAEVSGLVTFARTRKGNERLLSARRDGRYGRLYLGLSLGEPSLEVGRFEAAIGIDPADRRRRRVVRDERPDHERVRDAATRYRVLDRAGPAALLQLEPETGRTHQLRVHCADAGVPLLGDRHYGGPQRMVLEDGRVLMARRAMLHCTRLSLDLGQGRPLLLEALPPDDFQQLWLQLGGTALAKLLTSSRMVQQ